MDFLAFRGLGRDPPSLPYPSVDSFCKGVAVGSEKEREVQSGQAETELARPEASELQQPVPAHVFPASKPCSVHPHPLNPSLYGYYMPISVSNFCSPFGGSKIAQR